MTGSKHTAGLVLGGLDGANPLAFLAALGALRGLTLAWPDQRVCLSWVARDAWRPAIHFDGGAPTEKMALEGLEAFFKLRRGYGGALDIDESSKQHDLKKVTLPQYRERVSEIVGRLDTRGSNRDAADFVAAFGCEIGGRRDTDLSVTHFDQTAGQQRFLKTLRDLSSLDIHMHLERCLFGQWRRENKGLSLRWDPEEDRRYAFRWSDPSPEGAKTEWGANRLAFEALPLFPVLPAGNGAQTVGFTGTNSRNTFWSWPIWEIPADLDVVRSVLALRELQESNPNRMELAARGILEVYRSQRLTVGKYRNFTPARPV